MLHSGAANVWMEMGIYFGLLPRCLKKKKKRGLPRFLIKQLQRHYPLTSEYGNKARYIFMNLLSCFDCLHSIVSLQ